MFVAIQDNRVNISGQSSFDSAYYIFAVKMENEDVLFLNTNEEEAIGVFFYTKSQ